MMSMEYSQHGLLAFRLRGCIVSGAISGLLAYAVLVMHIEVGVPPLIRCFHHPTCHHPLVVE